MFQHGGVRVNDVLLLVLLTLLNKALWSTLAMLAASNQRNVSLKFKDY